MIRKIEDFLSERKYESEMTLKVFAQLNNEILDKKLAEKVRTIGRLAWHITETVAEMMNHAGLPVEGLVEEKDQDFDVNKIMESYRKSSSSLLEQVKKNWDDSQMEDMVDMYGDRWNKGTVLSILTKHEAHHRGQLTILMREMGLKVPGVYGPSQEEWVTFGMTPLK